MWLRWRHVTWWMSAAGRGLNETSWESWVCVEAKIWRNDETRRLALSVDSCSLRRCNGIGVPRAEIVRQGAVQFCSNSYCGVYFPTWLPYHRKSHQNKQETLHFCCCVLLAGAKQQKKKKKPQSKSFRVLCHTIWTMVEKTSMVNWSTNSIRWSQGLQSSPGQ